MGIARALRRVKRQAKRGGLGALRTGLGEELRSGSIPAPLQGAARRIAALIDPGSARRSSRKPGSSATSAVVGVPAESLRHAPREYADQLGRDLGDGPAAEPQAPANGTEVDAVAIGATPVYDATPVEAAPVDATPDDLSIPDAAAVVVASDAGASEPDASEPVASEPNASERLAVEPDATEPALSAPEAASAEEAAPARVDQPQAKKKGNGQQPGTAATSSEAKEKLAAPAEEAKSAARSGPKGKRPKGHGGKTSKKK